MGELIFLVILLGWIAHVLIQLVLFSWPSLFIFVSFIWSVRNFLIVVFHVWLIKLVYFVIVNDSRHLYFFNLLMNTLKPLINPITALNKIFVRIKFDVFIVVLIEKGWHRLVVGVDLLVGYLLYVHPLVVWLHLMSGTTSNDTSLMLSFFGFVHYKYLILFIFCRIFII